MLVRFVTGAIVFAACAVVLVIGYDRGEPIAEAKGGGVRAVGAMPGDYAPLPVEIPKEAMRTEVLAVESAREFFESQNCELRSVKCMRRMGADYCSLCLTHLVEPLDMLAAMLVRCRGDQCARADEMGEAERIGWNAEWACGFQFVGQNEWNTVE